MTPTRPNSPKVHGGLRVDPSHPHHFVFEDGTRYFLMGYECDWLWALDMNDSNLPTVNAFLDKLTAHSFNYVIATYLVNCRLDRARYLCKDASSVPPLR